MRFSNYIILLFCVSTVLYIMGFTSIGSSFVSKYGSELTLGTVTDILIANSGTILGLGIGLGAAAVAATWLSGFGAVYIIPAYLISVVVTIFVLPLSFLLDPSLDLMAKTLITGFFNIMMVLSVLDFIRGGA